MLLELNFTVFLLGTLSHMASTFVTWNEIVLEVLILSYLIIYKGIECAISSPYKTGFLA